MRRLLEEAALTQLELPTSHIAHFANRSESPPPPPPPPPPPSLSGTQRLMHHYTAINTLLHREHSHFHCYAIIILFPPTVIWAFSVLTSIVI